MGGDRDARSAPAVAVARLPDPPSGGFRAFVRFPPGWSRPTRGHYLAAEEMLVLDGALTLSGQTWAADGWARLPAGAPRVASSSALGALTLARFDGPPRWRPGDAPAAGAIVRLAHWRQAPRRPGPLGTAGWCLSEGPGHATWVIDTIAGGATARAEIELVSLADLTWAAAPAGAAVPALAGPVLVRLEDARSPRPLSPPTGAAPPASP